jgi:hypothetical protein
MTYDKWHMTMTNNDMFHSESGCGLLRTVDHRITGWLFYQVILKGEVSLYHWLVCFANKNKNCQLSYSWFQTGGQQYSDTSPFSISWFYQLRHPLCKLQVQKGFIIFVSKVSNSLKWYPMTAIDQLIKAKVLEFGKFKYIFSKYPRITFLTFFSLSVSFRTNKLECLFTNNLVIPLW